MLCYNDEIFQNVQTFVAGPDGFENVAPIFNILDASVLKVDLSNNDIVELNSTTFERFTNLRELNLSNSGLKTLDFNLLNYQKFLQYFDVSNNHLKEVTKPVLLQYLKQLKYFNAAGNQIRNANEILDSIIE